ncbi:MAG TPA: hypothetical protein DCE41_07980 [Cytophagales bacterium]|nr:hypothetical protein [Cytophagales bacterium]
MYSDGQLVSQIIERGEDFYDLGYVAQPNVEYELVITHPDYPTCRVTTSLPSPTQSSNLQIPDLVFEAPLQDVSGTFSLADPADEQNFYLFSFVQEWSYVRPLCCDMPDDTTRHRWTSVLTIEELGIAPTVSIYFNTGNFNGVLANDRILDGQTTEIHFHTPSAYYQVEGPYTYRGDLVVNHLSEDLYRYLQSWIAAEQANNNPFSQPQPIYSNVEGGFGIVAGYTQSVHSVEVEKP